MASLSYYFELLCTVVVLLLYAKGSYTSTLEVGLSFTSEPQDVIATKGQPLALNCAAESAEAYIPLYIAWTKNGDLINDTNSILRNGSLYFKKVVHRRSRGRSDEGIYQCIAQNRAGAILSRPARLQVAVLPRFTQSPLPQTQSVPIGGIARLSCTVKNAVPQASFTWSLNGEPLPQNSDRLIHLSSGILQIHEVRTSDTGNYRCKAINVAGQRTSQSAALEVTASKQAVLPVAFGDTSPVNQILNGPQNTSVSVGGTAILECLVEGDPSPLVTWERQDGSSLPDSAVRLRSNLKILNVGLEDGGVYICKVSTSGEPITAKATLTPLAAPVLQSQPRSIIRKPAYSGRFTCKASGSPPPTITWLKNGDPIEVNKGRIKTYKEANGKESLVVGQPNVEDAGYYQCMVSNVAGNVQAAALLRVIRSDNAPQPPQGLRGVALSDSEILVSWNRPLNNDIIAHSVHYSAVSEGSLELQVVTSHKNDTSKVIRNLLPYTNYSIYVVAYSRTDAGEETLPIVVATSENVPLRAPSVTVSQAGPDSLHVEWEPLSSPDTRGKVVKYRLHWRESEGGADDYIDLMPDEHDYLLGGLFPLTYYDVRVEAGTKKGFPNLRESEWDWVTERTQEDTKEGVPEAVDLFLVKVINATAVNITWTPKASSDIEIMGYQIEWRGTHVSGTYGTKLTSDQKRYQVVPNLYPDTTYKISLKAFNGIGDGEEKVLSVKTNPLAGASPSSPTDPPYMAIPPPPLHLTAETLNATAVLLRWSPPLRNSESIQAYTVKWVQYVTAPNGSYTTVEHLLPIEFASPGDEGSLLVTELQPSTMYEFSVASHSPDMVGPYSQPATATTQAASPSQPRDPKVVLTHDGSMELTWRAPLKSIKPITGYVIQYTPKFSLPPERWYIRKYNGTGTRVIFKDFEPSITYYFKLRAQTAGGGLGPWSSITTIMLPTDCLDGKCSNNVVGDQASSDTPVLSDQMMGVVIGISIGGTCIIICAIIILMRNRCFPPPTAQCRHGYSGGGNGHAHHMVNGHVPNGRVVRVSESQSYELESFVPMLDHTAVRENEESDTKDTSSTRLLSSSQQEGRQNTSPNPHQHAGPRQAKQGTITEQEKTETLSKELATKGVSHTGSYNNREQAPGDQIHDQDTSTRQNVPREPESKLLTTSCLSGHHPPQNDPTSKPHNQGSGTHNVSSYQPHGSDDDPHMLDTRRLHDMSDHNLPASRRNYNV
ncbi:unnamed protein product [Owenia fusiformis]|uniref:Uncharacterized protein n=1 Tax=Owenia fusiformis TaxID=6347 RepID=A0A8J1UHE0_OWEFU|nr:unnamed protein product [Owenia fusiformis]